MTTANLGSLFVFIRNGKSVRQQRDANGIPVSRIETISHGFIDPSRVGYAGIGLSEGRDWLLKEGDILFSHINSVEHVGKCAIYEGYPTQLVHGMNLLCLRPDPTKLWPKFALYLLRTPGFRAKLSNYINKAVNQASVSTTNLKQIKVCIPVLAEQRRIAAFLDQAEALRSKRRKTLAKLESLGVSVFLEMFGSPVVNPKSWPLRPIAKIGRVITGNTPSREVPEYFGNEIEWIKSDNLNSPQYLVTRSSEGLTQLGRSVARVTPRNSILVTCIAGSPSCIGNAGFADREVAFNQQINAIVPEIGNPHFIYALIRAGKKLIQQASTSGMKGMVSKSTFEKIMLPFPPLDLQELFASRIAAIENSRTVADSSLARIDALLSSIQHRAFRGEL
jgi:type I restriction enzyme S subunit